jgi:hypothetical protein
MRMLNLALWYNRKGCSNPVFVTEQSVSIMRACMLRRLCLKGKDDASLHLCSMQGKRVR